MNRAFQGFMNRAFVGNFQKPRFLRRVQFSDEFDFARKMIYFALSCRRATQTIFEVSFFMRDVNKDFAQIPTFAIGIKP